MNLIETMNFTELKPDDLEAYARQEAARLGVTIPNHYLCAVLDNLAALQNHAAILASAVDASDKPAFRAPGR